MSDTTERSNAAAALDEVAAEADAAAAEQNRLGRYARAAAGAVRGGTRWSDLADNRIPQRLLEGLMAASSRLGWVAGRLRMATVEALRAEGLTTRQVGHYLGISHQRVSSLQPRRKV